MMERTQRKKGNGVGGVDVVLVSVLVGGVDVVLVSVLVGGVGGGGGGGCGDTVSIVFVIVVVVVVVVVVCLLPLCRYTAGLCSGTEAMSKTLILRSTKEIYSNS